MDLSLRLNEHPRKEKCKSADREDSGCDKLYDSFLHIRFCFYVSDFVGFSVAAWVHATHQKTSAPTLVSRPQHAQQRF